MMGLVSRFGVSTLKFLRKQLNSTPGLRQTLYDLNNEKEFGNLYEHEKMLADSVRVRAYQQGIEKHVKEGDTVLDLGTGTGILAFFAARQKPKKVIALDHSRFINTAKEIARNNNISNIEFVNCNSRNFKTSEKVDVIIHEQIGDYLFNENMIHNLLDLKQRLLKPGGRIIPGRFELFLEPAGLSVESKVPFLWENEIDGIDFGCLKVSGHELSKYQPADYQQRWLEAGAVDYFLCEPRPVMAFDLNAMNSEEELPRRVEISKQVINPGPLDGFCLYFKVIFDEEIHFDSSPFSRKTHWGNCFFRAESHVCTGGENIRFSLAMPDLLNIRTWSVTSE